MLFRSSYLDVLLSYLNENMEDIDKKVCTKLCDYLIAVRLDVDDYWDNIKRIVGDVFDGTIKFRDAIMQYGGRVIYGNINRFAGIFFIPSCVD